MSNSEVDTIQDIQDLLGRLMGVLSDDDVNPAEVKSLQDYIVEHPGIELKPPFSAFANFLNNFENTVRLDRQVIKSKVMKYLDHLDLLYKIHADKTGEGDIHIIFKGMLRGIISDNELNLMELNDLYYLYCAYEDVLEDLPIAGMMAMVKKCITQESISAEEERNLIKMIEGLI